jgi:hypothetical protein
MVNLYQLCFEREEHRGMHVKGKAGEERVT